MAARLSLLCKNGGPGLIVLRQYGLIGYLRNYKEEIDVIEQKPSDVVFDDLRIHDPFPALLVGALIDFVDVR